MENILAIFIFILMIVGPIIAERIEFNKKINEDNKINYDNQEIKCNKPFEKNGRQYFQINCKSYQYNKIDYIENVLCKTGNDILYGHDGNNVKYFILGCFRQPDVGQNVSFHVMVEPDIEVKKTQVQYNTKNIVSGTMNGNFIVNINDQESIEILLEQLVELQSKVSEEFLEKEIKLFKYKLRLGELEKHEANDFLILLEKYKNVPSYASSIATVINAVFNFLN